MPKITPNITDEAYKTYQEFKGNKSLMISKAILSYSKDGLSLTEADRKWIMDRITEAVHACYKP